MVEASVEKEKATAVSIVDGKKIDLGGASGGRRLLNLRDLVTSTDDPLSLIVLHILHILVLPLSALPDLNLASSADNADSHGREQVVRGVGVHVNTTIEHGGSILANAGANHGFASRVMLDEFGDVVNNPGDGNQTAAVLGLVDKVVPFHNWERIERDTPVEFGALLVEFLLHLLDTALFDLVLFELFEIIRETKLLPHPD